MFVLTGHHIPKLALTLRPSPELAGGERRAMFNGVSDLRLIELNTLVDCCLLSQWQHEGVVLRTRQRG
jgi:hypothetical protein